MVQAKYLFQEDLAAAHDDDATAARGDGWREVRGLVCGVGRGWCAGGVTVRAFIGRRIGAVDARRGWRRWSVAWAAGWGQAVARVAGRGQSISSGGSGGSGRSGQGGSDHGRTDLCGRMTVRGGSVGVRQSEAAAGLPPPYTITLTNPPLHLWVVGAWVSLAANLGAEVVSVSLSRKGLDK